ncbi:MAG: adenosine kinase [Rhodospirillaceae bacterium]|nr:MAG: adenosine kinase [Rhodospirillaceae bacterium]
MTARLNVVGIGNAIVDVLAHADEDFLVRHALNKGTMALIDSATADKLYKDMASAIECSGGSAANTIAGLASLGGRGAFIGKVKNDELGKVFKHDIEAIGVDFPTAPSTDGAATARCLINVTPDAERTMSTFLGACVELTAADVDEAVIRDAQVTYLEGYLWDGEEAKAAFVKAAEIAHAAGREVSLSLSDPFCVGRHRESFLELVEQHVDILFANEEEIKALYEVDTFDAALQYVRGHCKVSALTRGAKGSVIVVGDEIHLVDAEPGVNVVDTTGAGDAYAAGFLFGYTDGGQNDLAYCGRLGSIASAEIISHFGARPETPLIELIKAKLG